MTLKRKIIASSLTAAFATGMGMPVWAADDVQTIVVTAQSRKQSMQDVPIAMNVVTMKEIGDLGASNLSEMNGYIPGLSVDGAQPTQPNFALRGIGTGDFGIATDAPVGVYVDGVYTGKTGGALINFNDIQRVEVLKGPQGTLFGRNSAAGAISIVTNEPGADKDASATLRYGKYQSVYVDGMANVPLSDTTALRVSAVSDHSDGWVKNHANGDQMGGSDAWGVRVAGKWSPSALTKVVLTFEHSEVDQAARPAFGVTNASAMSAYGVPIAPVPATYASFVNPRNRALLNDAPDSERLDFDGATLRIETPLAGMTFNSTTSWRKFNSFNRQDNDGTANVATYLDTANIESNTTWQQEFKLSAKNDRYDWVAGLSFFDAKATQTSDVHVTTDSLDTLDLNTGALGAGGFLFGGLLGTPSGTIWTESMVNGVKSNSVAAFGDVIWHLSPATNLTTGVRWTRDEKETRWYVPNATSSDGNVAALTMAGGFGATNIIFADAAATAAIPVKASASWTDLSPRVVIDHKLDANTLVFASLSKGYQSGGHSVFDPLAKFAPETMKNFEAGFKASFPRAKAVLNGSFFSYRFTNLQGIELVSAGAVPVYDITSSDIKANGIDLDGSIKLNSLVRLFGALEYLDQTFDKKAYGAGDMNGQAVGTPKLTLMAGASFGWAAVGGRADLTVQGTHSSKVRCNDKSIAEFGCQTSGAVAPGEARTRYDMKLGWMNGSGNYGVALIVNNLLDKQYAGAPGGQSGSTMGTYYSDVSAPRYVGVELKTTL